MQKILILAFLASIAQAGAQTQVNIKNALEVSFETDRGKKYQVFGAATPGGTWNQIGDPVKGDGKDAVFFFRVTPGKQAFFKVEDDVDVDVGVDVKVLAAALHREWSGKDFSGANLTGVSIRQKETLYQEEESFWDSGLRWRSIVTDSNFRGAKLDDTEMVWVDKFVNCNFRDTSFIASSIWRSFGITEFIGCDFTGAQLSFFEEYRIIQWWDTLELKPYVKFVNCVMPDGSFSGE